MELSGAFLIETSQEAQRSSNAPLRRIFDVPDRLQELVETVPMDGRFGSLVGRYCPQGWSPARLVEAVRRGDWGSLTPVAPRVVRKWFGKQPEVLLRLGTQFMVRKTEKLFILWCRRGLSVTVLGPDGAGKSTLAAGIQSSFYFPARVVYMGLFQRTFSERYPRPVRVVILLGMTRARYLVAVHHCSRGRLVMFDRYTYDAMLSLSQLMPWHRRWYYWILAHACPPPHEAIMLDVSGEIMYARKGEFSVAELEAERVCFLRLQEQVPGLHVVDATRPVEVVRADVVSWIWQRYTAHWRKPWK